MKILQDMLDTTIREQFSIEKMGIKVIERRFEELGIKLTDTQRKELRIALGKGGIDSFSLSIEDDQIPTELLAMNPPERGRVTLDIAATRPVIDAIDVCSSCGRAVCNKCVYIGRTIKCVCLTSLIAATHPVIDAIGACSSCGRAVCNKCVYIGRTLFRCQACGDSEFKIKKTLTKRIRKNHSTWMKRYSKAVNRNGGVILGACLCVCLLAASIKGITKGEASYDLTSEIANIAGYQYIRDLENKEIWNSMIYTGVLAGAVPFAVANFVMLYNAIYNKKYNIN